MIVNALTQPRGNIDVQIGAPDSEHYQATVTLAVTLMTVVVRRSCVTPLDPPNAPIQGRTALPLETILAMILTLGGPKTTVPNSVDYAVEPERHLLPPEQHYPVHLVTAASVLTRFPTVRISELTHVLDNMQDGHATTAKRLATTVELLELVQLELLQALVQHLPRLPPAAVPDHVWIH